MQSQNPTNKLSKRLAPQDFIVDRVRSGRSAGMFFKGNLIKRQRGYRGYNWHYRRHLTNDCVTRIFGEIHYLTEHAPAKVQKRWKRAKIRWHKRMAWWKSGINNRL